MTRRTTRAAVASLGAAALVVASLGGAVAQSPGASALPFYPDRHRAAAGAHSGYRQLPQLR